MNGVKSSSSHGSSSSAVGARSFDVSNEAEVLQLLNFVRRGPFSPEEKNTYRDTILDYTTTKDVTVLNTLIDAIAVYGVTITKAGTPFRNVQQKEQELDDSAQEEAVFQVDVTSAPVNSALSGLGIVRPRPQFSVTTPKPASPAPDLKLREEVTVKSAASEEESASNASGGVQITEQPTVENTVPPIDSMVQASKAEHLPQSDQVTKNEDHSAASVKSPIERIKEIKRRVNDAVGNPVHLIDADNEIGREYMNALLNAMKQVSDGSGEDMQHAMDRLENSYASVMRLLVEHPLNEKKEHTVSNSVDTSSTDEEKKRQTQITPPVPSVAAPTATPEPSVSSINNMSIQSEQNTEVVRPVPIRSTAQNLSAPATPTSQSSIDSVPVPHTPPPVSDNLKSDLLTQPKSLADQLDEKRASQDELTEQSRAKQETVAASTDPLLAPEISSGLQQLLSEWKLFKSSGIFGTGPSGYEHPLYQQLAALTMSTVVAGRFEKATPEMRQSISDYMNGWHYEQNVVHEMNETFEHYLRRVVKRILDKQKASTPSTPGA